MQIWVFIKGKNVGLDFQPQVPKNVKPVMVIM